MFKHFQPKTMLVGLLVLVSYLIFGWLGAKVRAISGLSPIIWGPSAIGLATFVLGGKKYWPFVGLGALLIPLYNGMPVIAAIFVALGSILESHWGAYLLKRYTSEKPRFNQISDILVLVGLVMILSTGAAAAIQVMGLFIAGINNFDDQLFRIWRGWWISEATGQLFLGTAFIYFWNEGRYHIRWLIERKWEAISLFVVVTLYCSLLFTNLASYNNSILIRPYVLFILISWAAVRLEFFGITIINLIVASTVLVGIVQGYVAFPTYLGPDYAIMIQLYNSALAISGLLLASSIRERSDALESRNEFLGIASHELKTPITSLKLNLQMLERNIRTGSNKVDPVTALNKVDRQVNRLVQIIDQLLDVSRAERKIITLHSEEVDLAQLVDHLLERLKGELQQAGCVVQLEQQAGIVGYWDPFRIEQVIENLISNSIKYAPGSPIMLITSESKGIVSITVQDFGNGIPLEKQAHIFDRFVRASTDPNVQGLGLGLFISKRIVEAHQGKISVKSRIRSGAAFHIMLPLKADSQSSA